MSWREKVRKSPQAFEIDPDRALNNPITTQIARTRLIENTRLKAMFDLLTAPPGKKIETFINNLHEALRDHQEFVKARQEAIRRKLSELKSLGK